MRSIHWLLEPLPVKRAVRRGWASYALPSSGSWLGPVTGIGLLSLLVEQNPHPGDFRGQVIGTILFHGCPAYGLCGPSKRRMSGPTVVPCTRTEKATTT